MPESQIYLFGNLPIRWHSNLVTFLCYNLISLYSIRKIKKLTFLLYSFIIRLRSVNYHSFRRKYYLGPIILILSKLLIKKEFSVKQLAEADLIRFHPSTDHQPDLAFRENFLRHLVWAGSSDNSETSNSTKCRNTVQGRTLLCDDKG